MQGSKVSMLPKTIYDCGQELAMTAIIFPHYYMPINHLRP